MFNWLSNLFQPRSSTVTVASRVPGSGALSPSDRLPVPAEYRVPVSPTHLQVYEGSAWVYIAVSRIAEAAALVPLHVYQMDGDRRVEVVRHPLERLLDAPNPFMSRFELMEQTLGLLELTGNAYWYLVGGSDGTPAEIWTLRPDRVSIVPDARSGVRGYLYEVDGQRIPLDPIEVVHFKRWHPGSDFYGLSALEAARVAVISDQAMAAWNRNTFGQDHGVPAGIVNIKEYVSDADFDRIKREWRTSYGGTQRRTAFLRGGSVEWQHIGLTHTDLDFLEGRRAHRDEILNIFGVPVALLSENATEANAKVAERMFIERTLYPKLVRLAQKITQELLPFWTQPGVEMLAEFADIRPTDTQARLAELRAAYPVLSINELRERYFHLPPVAWGDLPVNHPDVPDALADSIPDPAPDAAPDALPAKSVVSAASQTAPVPDALAELAQWERFALKRIGQPNGRTFQPRVIAAALAFEINAGLLHSGDAAEVRGVFRAARARLENTRLEDTNEHSEVEG